MPVAECGIITVRHSHNDRIQKNISTGIINVLFFLGQWQISADFEPRSWTSRQRIASLISDRAHGREGPILTAEKY